ncbi:MAG: phospholipase D-like domain-containing protein [Halomonas sp.]|nr:phospholipase D-like domain-containing protein [Halomonas sp.]
MHQQWRYDNRFTLLPASKRYLPAMLEAVDEARDEILFEQYLIESGKLADRFIEALDRAARRGVRVRMLLDNYGANGFKHHDRQRLRQAGVELRLFNPLSAGRLRTSMTRDHRKLLLIDRRMAFTGGYCITDKFLGEWYDVVIRIEGPVVNDWHALFTRTWESSRGMRSGRPIPIPTLSSERLPDAQGPGMPGRVTSEQGRRFQEVRYSLQQRIVMASRRVWICTPYFLPTPSLRQRMIAAAQRGVDTRLLVAGPKHDHPSVRYAGQRYYGQLLRAGVRIYEFQPAFTHAKFCLVDDWSTIGSCNFDHWSLRWNLEANQEVDDPGFAEEMHQLFQDNFRMSEEIDLQQWASRPWWQWCRERVLGTANAWMTLLR